MDWQLPDIGKTITNNILPSSLSRMQYLLRDTVILSVISMHFRIVSRFSHGYALGCIQSEKIDEPNKNSMNHVGHVLNDYFNRSSPQWRLLVVQT